METQLLKRLALAAFVVSSFSLQAMENNNNNNANNNQAVNKDNKDNDKKNEEKDNQENVGFSFMSTVKGLGSSLYKAKNTPGILYEAGKNTPGIPGTAWNYVKAVASTGKDVVTSPYFYLPAGAIAVTNGDKITSAVKSVTPDSVSNSYAVGKLGDAASFVRSYTWDKLPSFSAKADAATTPAAGTSTQKQSASKATTSATSTQKSAANTTATTQKQPASAILANGPVSAGTAAANVSEKASNAATNMFNFIRPVKTQSANAKTDNKAETKAETETKTWTETITDKMPAIVKGNMPTSTPGQIAAAVAGLGIGTGLTYIAVKAVKAGYNWWNSFSSTSFKKEYKHLTLAERAQARKGLHDFMNELNKLYQEGATELDNASNPKHTMKTADEIFGKITVSDKDPIAKVLKAAVERTKEAYTTARTKIAALQSEQTQVTPTTPLSYSFWNDYCNPENKNNMYSALSEASQALSEMIIESIMALPAPVKKQDTKENPEEKQDTKAKSEGSNSAEGVASEGDTLAAKTKALLDKAASSTAK